MKKMAQKKSKPMPKWTPAPAELVERFHQIIGTLKGVETRKMFGYPAAFVNGQMFSGLFQDKMILRLSEKDRAGFLQQQEARIFEPMPGRPMREYVVVPAAIANSVKEIAGWSQKSLDYAKSLPPKKSGKKK